LFENPLKQDLHRWSTSSEPVVDAKLLVEILTDSQLLQMWIVEKYASMCCKYVLLKITAALAELILEAESQWICHVLQDFLGQRLVY